jgi:molecular chaperone DnaJ
MSKDYYKILQVPRNASKEDVKKAYRKLAHQHHPDKTGGDEQKFKEINEAYQILGDEQKRAHYDQFGTVFEHAGGGRGPFQGGFSWAGGGSGFQGFDMGEDMRGFAGFDFSDVFEEMGFGGGGSSGRSGRGSKKGRDIEINLDIPFEEMIFGGKHEVDLQKLTKCVRCEGGGAEPNTVFKKCARCRGTGKFEKAHRTFLGVLSQVGICPDCRGRGEMPESPCNDCGGAGVREMRERIEIFVPKGINHGEILKLSGKGEASLTGGVPGDLFARISIMPNKQYRRQGNDLIAVLSVAFSQAILGDKVEMKTPDAMLMIKIPEGTESGDILKVRGRGVPSPQGYGRGDLLVEIKVITPRKISKKAKELIEELKKEGV